MDVQKILAQAKARNFWVTTSEVNAPDWANAIAELGIAEIFLPRLSENDSVLDVGCGDGRFTLQVARKCGSVVACDLSPGLIENAVSRGDAEGLTNVDFFVRDVLTGVRGDTYDHVMALGLFTCMPDDDQFLNAAREVAAKVKEGGYLLLKDSVMPGEELVAQNEKYAAIYRNESAYLGWFESLGFVVEEIRPIGPLPDGQTSKLFLLRKPLPA